MAVRRDVPLGPWTCIFGDGCQGVLTGPAPELVQGCCSYGAHFTDKADRRRVERLAKKLTRRRVAVQEAVRGSGAARSRQRRRRDRHPARRRRLHLPQPSRFPRRSRLRAAPGRAAPGRASARLEAGGVLAAARCAASTTTDGTGTSPRRSASGSAATGARAARSSTGGAPTRPRRSWPTSRCTRPCGTSSSRWSARRPIACSSSCPTPKRHLACPIRRSRSAAVSGRQ